MQELQGDVDPPEKGRVAGRHVFELDFPTNLQIRETEGLLDPPHGLTNDDRGRNLKHTGRDVGPRRVTASTHQIDDSCDLIVGQGEGGEAEGDVRREQRHPASVASDRRG